MYTKGWGPWKQGWYSFCSAAHNANHDPSLGCKQCAAGDWEYVLVVKAEEFCMDHLPRLYFWWTTRKL